MLSACPCTGDTAFARAFRCVSVTSGISGRRGVGYAHTRGVLFRRCRTRLLVRTLQTAHKVPRRQREYLESAD